MAPNGVSFYLSHSSLYKYTSSVDTPAAASRAMWPVENIASVPPNSRPVATRTTPSSETFSLDGEGGREAERRPAVLEAPGRVRTLVLDVNPEADVVQPRGSDGRPPSQSANRLQ